MLDRTAKPLPLKSATQRDASLVEFTKMRMQALGIASQMAALPDLPAHYRAQARAIAGLSGLLLSRIVGEASRADAGRIVDDLEAMWRILDPMIRAVGDHAAENFNGIEKSLFDDQLRGALEGNATFEVTKAGDEIEETRISEGSFR